MVTYAADAFLEGRKRAERFKMPLGNPKGPPDSWPGLFGISIPRSLCTVLAERANKEGRMVGDLLLELIQKGLEAERFAARSVTPAIAPEGLPSNSNTVPTVVFTGWGI